MCGTPDGLEHDNGDGTFTLLCNHEFVNTAGVGHGHDGHLFVSKWIINKSDLKVLKGSWILRKNVKSSWEKMVLM